MRKNRGTGFSFDHRPAPAARRGPPRVIPKIMLEGKDITGYLYGRAARIMTDAYPTYEMLVSIRDQVARLASNAESFDVRLSAIKAHEVKPGDRLLVLDAGPAGITKQIIKITSVEKTDRDENWFKTECLYPSWFEGSEGGFVQNILELDERSTMYPTLYLGFYGKVPEQEESFFSKMMVFAGEFSILSHLWAVAYEARLRNEPFMDRGPYDGAWKHGFEKKHGNRFQHRLVGDMLTLVFDELRVDRINKIYDDRPMLWEKIDFITPLLWQMQTDILERMHEEPELVTEFFGKERNEWTKRRMRVLFERYYGPKGMVHQPQPSTPTKPKKARTSKANLEGIIKLINYGATEGERAAARHVYQHETGEAYAG